MRDFMKRLFDVLFATVMLIVLSPLMLVLAVLVMIFHGRPVLFHQVRAGLNDHPFRMFKFRTMTNERGPDGALLRDDLRLTRFGRFLRGTSLDELPEFWNVLAGHMSVIGPRPLLTAYVPLYSPQQKRRHEVRPGITGWAQVNGRNELTWEDRFTLDVWYVDHQSFWLDMKILCLTAWRVLRREGVSAANSEIMPRFTGSGRGAE